MRSMAMLLLILTAGLIALEMNMPALQNLIDPSMYAYILLGVNIINMVLRVVTKAPITAK